MEKRLKTLWLIPVAAAAILNAGATESIEVGPVRVQLLSDSLLRLEVKGAAGFEDRPTFHVVNRDWPGARFSAVTNNGLIEIKTENYSVRLPQTAAALADAVVLDRNGHPIFRQRGPLTNSVWLPAPGAKPAAWSFADTPRLVPPPWGLTPPPEGQSVTNGGWDLGNDAPDIYIFVPQENHWQLRKDFLKLTGPTELPPLFTFGAFDSRWYDYSERTALKQIDDYRAHKIPLDVLVVDTGWRKGASTGYQPNTDLFPDMKRFLAKAHEKNVKVMFNDHPEPVNRQAPALNPEELNYRFAGLSGLLNAGLDFWWFDRNWPIALTTPARGLRKEVWGMRLYHDTTARVRPEARPLIMANADGVDNGWRNAPMDVAAHRFPIQWSGDISPSFDQMQRSVENSVRAGAQSAFPYLCDDLGGYAGDPTPEGFLRWIEYGAFAPIYRLHCKHNHERMPWTFGAMAETTARKFVNLRYRLLPVIYAAARANYDSGRPLLARLDLDYPGFPEAARDGEYLFGQDLLVAPVVQSAFKTVPPEWLSLTNGAPGLSGEYFANASISNLPALTRTDAKIDFYWREKEPVYDLPKSSFSIRWTGQLTVPATVGDVVLSLTHDEGVRLWVDDQLILDATSPENSRCAAATVKTTAGVPHRLRVDYLVTHFQSHYNQIQLQWRPAASEAVDKSRWVPPGQWRNAWNDEIVSGPAMVTNRVPPDQIPLFIRACAVFPLAPEMQFTSEKPWDTMMLDVYPELGKTNAAVLYEDDTQSIGYQRGEFRQTQISVWEDQPTRTVSVGIAGATGAFPGALDQRTWTLRIHKPAGWTGEFLPSQVSLNGTLLDAAVRRLPRNEHALPLGDKAGAPDGDVYEVTLPATAVTQKVEVQIN
ncbi:MAG TPA: TIM-barrel domain-containing protein [Verrucomicrobiae bacterium]